MKSVIVLAVQGAPPTDFPKHELSEYLGLAGLREHGAAADREAIEARYRELGERLRGWPRTADNDPFWAASIGLGELLRRETGCEVVVGFDDFCAPTIDVALDQAASKHPRQIVVATPLLTDGADAQQEIPAAIERARARHPDVAFLYAWPYDANEVSRFLAEHLARFL